MKKVDLKVKVMGKERSKPAKDCDISLVCYLKGGCLKSDVLDACFAETIHPKELLMMEYKGWRDIKCSYPQAKRFELKIRLAGNQEMLHPSRRRS